MNIHFFFKTIIVLLFLTLSIKCYDHNIFNDMLKDSSKHIIMDWSRKAACTEMVARVLQNMNIYQDINYTGSSHQYRTNIFYDKYGHVENKELYSDKWYKFKVVRNPYSRAVSSYYAVMTTPETTAYLFSKNKEIDKTLSKTASFKEFYEYATAEKYNFLYIICNTNPQRYFKNFEEELS
jgi:hypothetical protein